MAAKYEQQHNKINDKQCMVVQKQDKKGKLSHA
jgi:hypothetical protein